MNTITQQLLSAALALPDNDRRQLTEALIVSLPPDERPPVENSLRHDVERRSNEHDDRDRLAAEELARITPTNEELLKLAQMRRPPASWFEGEEEKPW